MPAKTTVLLGPAGTGKTSRLLDRYRVELAKAPASGRGLWLAPTHRAADAVRGRLLDERLRASLAPNCLTFAQFADAILRASPTSIRPLDPLQKRQLIRRLVNEVVTKRKLEYFRPIAHTDGLIDLISDLFSDLKRQEIWPEEFTRVCRKIGNAPKNCELAGLYERYQSLLIEHQLYDEEGRFWFARDLLVQGQTAPFGDVALVVVDGFADFTHTQHEILTLLQNRVAEMLISLPWGTDRDDLFYKSKRTLAQLERNLPGLKREALTRRAASSDGFGATIAHIEEQLFSDPRNVEVRTQADGVEILAASGQLGELELLASKIKRLLFENDPRNGGRRVRPGDIAVVFRSTADVAALVREVFTNFGIPFAIDTRVPLGHAPVVAALLSFLKLEFEDWPFRRLLQLHSNNYFQPAWPEWRQEGAPAAAERTVRALQIPKGRRALLSAVERWASAELPDSAPDRRRKRQAAARIAGALLNRLAGAFDVLPTSATTAEWSSALQSLADNMGMLKVARQPCALPIARQDAAAWEMFIDRLEASADLETRIDGAVSQSNRRAILERIEQICRVEELPHEHDEAGRVRVLSAVAVRALNVPYLFVAGLSEKAFPASAREDRIYGAAEHRQLNEEGLRFVERRERACEEMVLFYEVVTRATERLYLSYSALDEAAQPLSPSPYITEIERLFSPSAIDRSGAPNLSPIPVETQPYCPRDFRVKAIAMALDGSPGLAGSLVSRAGDRSTTGSLLAALRATGQRSRRKEFGAYEGMILGPEARGRLAARFGPEHCWSTSQLEQYGYCPHQFFLQRVLALHELDDLSLEVNHFLRGRRVHALLAEVHRQLNSLGEPCPPAERDVERFDRLVSETLAAVMEQSASDGALESAFDWIDHRLIERWVKQYLEQYRRYDEAFKNLDSPPAPKHFEVSFGPAQNDDDSEQTDPISQRAPFELVCNGVTIRLSGRVDRIDIGLIDGQVVFNVLDYKTSPSAYYRPQDILDCKALQLPLYAMAVQELLLADQNAIPWQAGYWHVKDRGREGGFNPKRAVAFHEQTAEGIRRTQQWAELRERLVARVAGLVAGTQRGEFPMHCDDEHCTGRCQYKTVCRVHAVRSLEKTWQPPSMNAH